MNSYLKLSIGIMVIIFWTISLILLRNNYKKNNKQIFTNNKIAFFGIMLAISIPLNYFGIWLGPPGTSPKISFDYLPIIIVAFLLGPIEGFIFGVLSDSIILLLSGFPWHFFMAIQKPTIGLVSGMLFLVFAKNNKIENEQVNYKIIFALQLSIISIFISTQLILFLLKPNETLMISSFAASIITFIIFEIMFVYYFVKKKKEINMLSISLIIIIVTRVINSWIFTSIAQTFYGIPFEESILLRIITTSITGPINGVVLFWLLKGLMPTIDRYFDNYNKWS